VGITIVQVSNQRAADYADVAFLPVYIFVQPQVWCSRALRADRKPLELVEQVIQVLYQHCSWQDNLRVFWHDVYVPLVGSDGIQN